MVLLQFFAFLFGLVMIHELGHVISAKLLGLPIQRIGFQFKPYPHFYVAVKWPKNRMQKFVYLFSGTSFTLVLFVISICNHFYGLSILYWVFLVQLTIEINPFYSDFTIAFVNNNKLNKRATSYAENYKIEFQKYQYTAKWYFHFVVWTSIIVLLIQFKDQLV